jgi:thioredoxin 1
MAMEFTDQNFEQEVIKSELPALVDFWAPWCGPCQMMGPIIEELAKEMEGKAKIGKLNVDEHSDTASRYGIMSIPSLKIFNGGKVVKEFVGVQNKDILKDELIKLVLQK